MPRILSIIATVPFVLAFILWMISQFRPGGFSLQDPPPNTSKMTWTTTFLGYSKYYDTSVTPSPRRLNLWFLISGRRAILASDVRLRYCRETDFFETRFLILSTLGLVPIALQGDRWFLKRHGRARGMCSSCGYDLRVSPDRCPECGQVVAPHPPHTR